MNRMLVSLASALIPGKRNRRIFRRKMLPPDLKNVFGSANVVIGVPPECKVQIYGNNNRVEFLSPRGVFLGRLQVGSSDCPVENCTVTVGPRTDSVGLTVWMMEDNSSVRIGADCLISQQVQFWCSDTHALVDGEGRVLNAGPHRITVGDRSWIGYGAQVLKGVTLPPGSIVGLGAVVAGKSFSSPNCAYAGNPARVIREGVRWDKRRPKHLAPCEAGRGMGHEAV